MDDFETQLQEAKDKLGSKYLLHPSNQVKKKKIKKTDFQKLVSKVSKIKHTPIKIGLE